MTFVENLRRVCHIVEDYPESDSFILRFVYEPGSLVSIRIGLNDHQSGADMVITNLRVHPDEVQGRGYGTRALQTILVCAKEAGMREIWAVQVSTPKAEAFWQKNGFVPLHNETGDFRLVD